MRNLLLAATLLAGVSTTNMADAAELIHGVASGDVSANGVTLWGAANVPGTFSFDIAATSDFASVLYSASTAATSVPVQSTFSGLASGTTYFYRGTDAGGDVSTGTFRTAAAPGNFAGLRFGVTGDTRGDLLPAVSIGNVASRDLAFMAYLGDTIYADVPSPALPVAQATSIGDYRTKHAEQLLIRDGLNAWVEARKSTTLFATIDDHEVTNDFAGADTISADPRFAGTGAPSDLINTSTLYKDGLQAFGEYMPNEERIWAGTGDSTVDGRPDLYRAQQFGKDAVFIVTDARSFRDAGIDDSNPAVTLATAYTPGRTMLGEPQLDQLKQDLIAAQANGVTWKFVSIAEPIQNFGPLESADRYEGYAAERTELLKFIAENDIRNVVFVAADIHGSSVNNLTYQDVNNAAPQFSFLNPQIATSAWEITTGAVSYDPPFGPTLAGLGVLAGLLTPGQLAFYDSLPIAPDADDFLNDKDDFIKALINGQLASLPSAYSPIGLGDSGIDATLLQGDYLIGHSYGWTEFEIEQTTQKLTVTTWGINYDQVNNALGDPLALSGLTPTIMSQFSVNAVVPEPATWAMMIGGMGAVGGAMRRRQRTRTVAV